MSTLGLMGARGSREHHGNRLIAVGVTAGTRRLLGAAAMGRDSNCLIVVGATGARRLLGATALGRNGWGTTAMGRDGSCLKAVGAGAQWLLGTTTMGCNSNHLIAVGAAGA